MEVKRILVKGPNNLKEYVTGVAVIFAAVFLSGTLIASVFSLFQDGSLKNMGLAFHLVAFMLLFRAALLTIPGIEFSTPQRIKALYYTTLWLGLELSPAFLSGRIQEFALYFGATVTALILLIWAGTKITDERYQRFIRVTGNYAIVFVFVAFFVGNDLAARMILIASLLLLVRYGFEFSEIKTSRADMIAWAATITFEAGFFLVYALRIFAHISL